MTDDILAFDVGGSGLKAAIVDPGGKLVSERLRTETPVGSPPGEIVDALVELAAELPAYGRIAVGFPGMVRHGVVRTAPNLEHEGWRGFPLADRLQERLGKPVRLANDADVQGLAVIEGRGVEMVVTLGTGFGTGLYDDGRLCPHLEIAHMRFRAGETYDEQLGEDARQAVGNKKWRRRLHKAIEDLRMLTDFDRLYVGGGNARHLGGELPEGVVVVENKAGIQGGAFLWRGA